MARQRTRGRLGIGRELSVERRMAAMSATGTVLVCLCALLSGLTVRSWAVALDHRRTLRDVPNGASALRLAYSDQEAGLRAYLLTGEERDLEPYTRGRIDEARANGPVELRVRNLSDLRAALTAVQEAARAWQDRDAEPQIERRRTSAAMSARADAIGRRHMAELRLHLDRFDTLARARLSLADAHTRRLQRLMISALATTFVLSLGGLGLATILVRRWIIHPLAAIGTTARSIGRNESDAMPRFGSAELDDVSTAVEFLHRARAEERDKAVRAFAALEQGAVLAIKVRDELGNARVSFPGGWTTASLLRSAEGIVAGDCFDLGLIDQHTAYVVVIDVTGHGAPAALTALKAKSQLRSAIKAGMSPGDAMRRLASHREHDESTEYLTAFAAVIDLRTGTCSYANAGHPPALIGSDARRPVELGATGPLIGPFRRTWSTAVEEIRPGESLLVYTDGLTEACGPQRQRLGDERVLDCISAVPFHDAQHLVRCILDLYSAHLVGAQTDDVTVVALHRAETADE